MRKKNEYQKCSQGHEFPFSGPGRQCQKEGNEVFSDGIYYDDETMRYIKYLGEINVKLGKEADNVIEVVYSIPVYHKGDVNNVEFV